MADGGPSPDQVVAARDLLAALHGLSPEERELADRRGAGQAGRRSPPPSGAPPPVGGCSSSAPSTTSAPRLGLTDDDEDDGESADA